MSEQPKFVNDIWSGEVYKAGLRAFWARELLFEGADKREAIYKNRSRWWLLKRRATNWLLFRLLSWAERKKFVESAHCYECQGYPEPTTDETYFAGWKDE